MSLSDRFGHLFIAPGDFSKSLVFYREVLGWSLVTSWGNEAEGRGAVLSGGGVKVVLAERHGSMAPSATHGVNGPRPNVHLDIHDIDARFRMLPAGDHVVVHPENTHWGTRWFVVRDPDGNLFAFEELPTRRG